MTREQIIEKFQKELERRCADPSVYYSGNISWCKQFVVDLVNTVEEKEEDESDSKLIGYTNEGYPIYTFD